MNKSVFLVRNVAPGNYGGGEIYQLKLARELKMLDYEPIIITNSKGLLREAENDGYKVLIPPYSGIQNWSGWRNILLPVYFVFQKRLRRWYRQKIKECNPIVINIQSRDDLIAGTVAAKKMGVCVIWTDHADFRNWVLWNVNVRFKNIIGKRIIKLSRNTEKVIFIGKTIAIETQRMIRPLVLRNTVVIENGVEDKKSFFKKVKEKNNSFVFLGRVTEEKGVLEMLSAFMKVIEKYPEAILNIYGDGDIKKFNELCEQLGPPSRVMRWCRRKS